MTESSFLMTWVFLPAVIFLARTADVSMATLRIVFVAQGRRALAPIVGFFESLLWLLIVGQALKHMGNPACVIAYAGGFAAGNVVGLIIEGRLAMGMRIVRIILHQGAEEVTETLRDAGFGVTVVDGEGRSGPVQILFTMLRRRDVERLVGLVRQHSPHAVYSVEDVRQAGGTYPRTRFLPFAPLRWPALRKSK